MNNKFKSCKRQKNNPVSVTDRKNKQVLPTLLCITGHGAAMTFMKWSTFTELTRPSNFSKTYLKQDKAQTDSDVQDVYSHKTLTLWHNMLYKHNKRAPSVRTDFCQSTLWFCTWASSMSTKLTTDYTAQFHQTHCLFLHFSYNFIVPWSSFFFFVLTISQ